MTSTPTPLADRTDVVHRFAAGLSAGLDRVASAPAWAMTPTEQAETLVELAAAEARLTELRWRVLVAADRNEVGAKDGHANTAAWLAAKTRHTRARCHGDLRAARLLDEPLYATTREALAAGRVTVDQAWVILRAIEDLPAKEVTDEQRVTAQAHLVGLAADHDAKSLRILARRLFEVLAPAEADRREGQALENEERKARERCRFAIRDNGDGTHSGWFKLPDLHAQMLTKAVQALAAPRRTDPTALVDADGNRRPYASLLGDAFADLIEHLPVDKLPQAGGTAATVVVTIRLSDLRDGLGAGVLDTGGRISAGQARRLACNASLVPAVLGTRSEPLDLGRKTRLHTGPMRTAMALRDQGCTADGCDRPPAWCEAHHDPLPWSRGGRTSVTEGRLLCPHHHRLAHDDHYDTRRLPDGKVRFNRRT